MQKVLVTGGAGFIGSNLVKELLKKRKAVTVVDNFSQGDLANLSFAKKNKDLKIVKADILDTKKMINVSKRVDIIFHLAVQCLRVSLSDPLFVEKVNASGTLSVLWAAHINRVKKFVYCSSSEVYGSAISVPMREDHSLNPTTVYGASKLSGETYTTCFGNNFGFKTTIVRPFNTYGYNEHVEGVYGEVIPRFIVLAKNNKPLTIFGNGLQTRDFTFVTDTVKGLVSAGLTSKSNGRTLNLAYGKEISIKRIAEIVIKLTKSKSKIVYKPARPHDVKRHFANTSLAKNIINFEPKTNIDEGIKLYIKYLEQKKTNYRKILNELPEKNW